ncbi:DUF2852 domain-containing protein [Roseovarius salinarum]|uniref:DUF2852 domain-containing protein n=1 Tax=Roseovarius salinarum TaxID=1981892 RepID=UPI000C322D6D|nr:DUF2852 domain-containing protein [Roseovarius salinarum]
MTTLARSAPDSGPLGWLARAESWLDDRGKGAWITAMVLGFILFWPIGLALLFYMIWSNRMFCKTDRKCRGGRRHRHAARAGRPTGNTAFDTYREETLRRLEEEQESFEAFLQRLREAKDKAEFDQFMAERARAAAADTDEGGNADATRA